jgi:DNA-binding response OmpR family regulator
VEDQKTKILIVDDEPINLDFFDVMLTKLGFEVDIAEDGEAALEKVKEFHPDVIMLDNIMPKLTGWEVTKILKKNEDWEAYRHIPIIMFSAMDDVRDKVEGFELGVEDYITKPFNFSEVLARIKAVLHNRELQKQVILKERKIALSQSLNKSLVYFTRHLREPVLELLNRANDLDKSDPEAINDFVTKVTHECEQVLATLGGLEEEIEELENKAGYEADSKHILEDLEEKFQKQFSNWKKQVENLDGVSR